MRLEVDESKLPQTKVASKDRKATLPFPAQYADEDASDLKATVKPDAAGNNIEFNLSKQTEQARAGRKGER